MKSNYYPSATADPVQSFNLNCIVRKSFTTNIFIYENKSLNGMVLWFCRRHKMAP